MKDTSAPDWHISECVTINKSDGEERKGDSSSKQVAASNLLTDLINKCRLNEEEEEEKKFLTLNSLTDALLPDRLSRVSRFLLLLSKYSQRVYKSQWGKKGLERDV